MPLGFCRSNTLVLREVRRTFVVEDEVSLGTHSLPGPWGHCTAQKCVAPCLANRTEAHEEASENKAGQHCPWSKVTTHPLPLDCQIQRFSGQNLANLAAS